MIIKNKGLEIRPINESEIVMVLEVYRECEDFLKLGPEPKASLMMVKLDIANSRKENGVYCGIFAKKNRMMGIVDFVPKNYSNQIDWAFLSLLMIAKPYRNQGIGTMVVKMVESEIRKDPDIKYIYAGVQVNNELAIRFWRKMGYEIYEVPELLADQSTVYHLKKKFSRLADYSPSYIATRAKKFK